MNSKKIKDTLGSTGTILSRKKFISDEFLRTHLQKFMDIVPFVQEIFSWFHT